MGCSPFRVRTSQVGQREREATRNVKPGPHTCSGGSWLRVLHGVLPSRSFLRYPTGTHMRYARVRTCALRCLCVRGTCLRPCVVTALVGSDRTVVERDHIPDSQFVGERKFIQCVGQLPDQFVTWVGGHHNGIGQCPNVRRPDHVLLWGTRIVGLPCKTADHMCCVGSVHAVTSRRTSCGKSSAWASASSC